MSQRPILRRCVSCRKLLNRKQLIRITRDFQDGVVLEDGMGRSAYLCQNKDCIEEACRRKRIQKALRCQIPESVLELLQKRVNDCMDRSAEAI